VIMHRIWVDGTEFRWTREQATAVSVGAASIHPRAMFNEPIADLRVGRPLQ
jgi:hypothetical protein